MALLKVSRRLRRRPSSSRTRSAKGVMPTNAMARAFIDHAGRLHQRLAEKADQVLFMTAGILPNN